MKKTTLFFFVLFLALGFRFAQAEDIYIDVGQAQVKKSLIAITPIHYLGAQKTNKIHLEVGELLYKVINNDLAVSGYFSAISPDAYLEEVSKVGLRPAPGESNGFSFDKWKPLGADFLIRSGYQVIDKKVVFETYLYHVPQAKLILGRTYEGSTNAARRIAHRYCNDILEALTGKKGMFLTRAVATRQDGFKKPKEVYVLDWDGQNQDKITNHLSISVSPTWSPNGEEIAYTSFSYHTVGKTRNSDLFIYNLKTNKRFLVSYRKGLNNGASYFPDGKNLLLTLSVRGNPDLYKMSSDGSSLVQLTNGPNGAMNVEGAVSPDGSKIAFASDRGGNPMIYMMNADGSEAQRKISVGKYNASPAWSPDGKKIAFAGQESGAFDIFVMDADGQNKGLKRLTTAHKPNGKKANNESPSWSPDGRHIMFVSDRTGQNQIYIINPDGTNERRITFDSFNWDKPKWSPFLD